MAKKGKNSGPFLRGKYGVYYCWIEGRLLSLRTDKPRVAEREYREKLKALEGDRERERREVAPATLTVRECFALYLEHARGFKPHTYANRKADLDRFAEGVGHLPHDRITHDHVEAWLDSHPDWSPSTRRWRINGIVAAFNFCVRRRRIAANPLAGIVKPRWERRRHAIGDADDRALHADATGEFLAILGALRETGARPSELCRATVRDYRDGMIVLSEHKEKGRVDTRTIHLTPGLRQEVERLVAGRPDGPIWRNSVGNAWTPNALFKRFQRARVRLKLGEGVFPYALRGKFASDAINESDANPAIVAKLLGHANMDMLLRHYYRENPEAAAKALEEIRRPKGDPPSSPPPPPAPS